MKCKHCGSTRIYIDAIAMWFGGHWCLDSVRTSEIWCGDCFEKGWNNIEEDDEDDDCL